LGVETHRFFDIFAGQCVQHKLQNAILEFVSPVLLAIGDIRALQQRVDVANGACRHLELFHQATNNEIFERTSQSNVKDTDVLVF